MSDGLNTPNKTPARMMDVMIFFMINPLVSVVYTIFPIFLKF